MNGIANDSLGLRKRMIGKPTIIGHPSGRMSGRAVTESGRGFQVHESPKTSSIMSPQFAKRIKFKEFLHNKYGLPRARPMSEGEINSQIASESKAKERLLSQHVFGERGRESGNRGHDVIWNKALTQMRNNIKTRIMGETSGQRKDYDFKKGMIDEEMKAYDIYVGKSATRIKADRALKKEQRTSEARLKAADTKYIRNLEKELRKQEAELRKQEAEGRNVLVEGKAEPLYEATKHSVQELKDKIGELKGTKKAEPKEDMGMADDQIAEILKQNGFAITPENIARFKAQN